MSAPLLPFIAPLWTPYRLQVGGYAFSNADKDDPERLRLARQLILSQNPDLSDYQPSLVYIVTWQNFLILSGAQVSLEAA
jgi:hypothetical protein